LGMVVGAGSLAGQTLGEDLEGPGYGEKRPKVVLTTLQNCKTEERCHGKEIC